jgi:bacterioferritin-associated ferredoxin
MVVCICNNVTEKDIKRAIRDGASSMTCLQERLAVSTRCGQCHSSARACLDALVDRDLNDTVAAPA